MQYMSFIPTEDYQELIEDIVRDGRLYASENHQEILKVSLYVRWTRQPPRAPGTPEGAFLLLHVAAFQTRSLLWAELIFIFSMDFVFWVFF